MIANKRGQELTLGTIILIVLGVVVLIFLIYGFSTGWTNLWDRVTNYAGGKSNFDTINNACTIACSSREREAWCTQQRTVKFGKEIELSGVKSKIGIGVCNNFAQSKISVLGTEVSFNDELGNNLKITPCPEIIC
jgi:hypothetical protein